MGIENHHFVYYVRPLTILRSVVTANWKES